MKTRYQDIAPFVTRDGSVIRELMHPQQQHAGKCFKSLNIKKQSPVNQSLAEAIVLPGQSTKLHRHQLSEELYHITAGQGLMTLSEESFEVSVGDTVCIPPGTPHRIENIGDVDLKILCCCAPAYAHDDTELLE